MNKIINVSIWYDFMSEEFVVAIVRSDKTRFYFGPNLDRAVELAWAVWRNPARFHVTPHLIGGIGWSATDKNAETGGKE